MQITFYDWNCGLYSLLITEKGPERMTKALAEMQQRIGFQHFCMLCRYNPEAEPVSVFLLRYRMMQEKLKGAFPAGTTYSCAVTSLLTPDLWEDDQLDRLLYRKRERILPIQLPMGNLKEWIEPQISQLLYKRKYRLWFTSFEYAVLCYPEDVILRLSRIKGGVFSFGYKSLCEEKVLETIKRLLENHATVLLGSGIASEEKIYFYELDAYLKIARSYLGNFYFDKLMHGNRI